MLLLLFALLVPLPARAGPVLPRADDTLNDSNFSARIWIPITVLSVVVMILPVLACSRTLLRRQVVNMGQGTPPRSARLLRPTPSQISTISLPVYMKEPGAQERVVSRGPDGKDVQASADDDAATTHGDAISINPPPRAYRLPPASPPLVGDSTPPDPRGATPAYFEAIEHWADSAGVGGRLGSSEGEGGDQRILDPAQIPVPPSPTASRGASGAFSHAARAGTPQHDDSDDDVIRMRAQEPTDATAYSFLPTHPPPYILLPYLTRTHAHFTCAFTHTRRPSILILTFDHCTTLRDPPPFKPLTPLTT
ncbi:hypothetical protein C8J57DRAFT_1598050 [Mycena rebaudengoi]|nr:hypothetical protein C8J57DRAFT_1598050 [Mycena rebaudengoi]